eukprot:scaffold9890_cov45-Phaeocystis_antarctica.AAC.1
MGVVKAFYGLAGSLLTAVYYAFFAAEGQVPAFPPLPSSLTSNPSPSPNPNPNPNPSPNSNPNPSQVPAFLLFLGIAQPGMPHRARTKD